MTEQKGIDLIAGAGAQLVALPAQLAVLGSGEQRHEQTIARLARAHPGRIAARIGFDEVLAHLVEAGADAFLMPSRFEPCGLNQMYSQRYGTPPVVRATGGLADSVVDLTDAALENGTATGFLFREPTAQALLAAAQRAHVAWQDRPLWRRLQQHGMARDFSWDASAREYAALYSAVARRA
jgi:starch synthase